MSKEKQSQDIQLVLKQIDYLVIIEQRKENVPPTLGDSDMFLTLWK